MVGSGDCEGSAVTVTVGVLEGSTNGNEPTTRTHTGPSDEETQSGSAEAEGPVTGYSYAPEEVEQDGLGEVGEGCGSSVEDETPNDPRTETGQSTSPVDAGALALTHDAPTAATTARVAA